MIYARIYYVYIMQMSHVSFKNKKFKCNFYKIIIRSSKYVSLNIL